ncbi:hypothetical protein STANM309S_06224 [Streptomyces tanashiensis]
MLRHDIGFWAGFHGFHRRHGFHGLHGLHGLHGFHRLHGFLAGKVKTLPFVVTLVVSVATVFVCGEFFGFPWWLRLITVVGVGLALEAANQAVGRARARKRAL